MWKMMFVIWMVLTSKSFRIISFIWMENCKSKLKLIRVLQDEFKLLDFCLNGFLLNWVVSFLTCVVSCRINGLSFGLVDITSYFTFGFAGKFMSTTRFQVQFSNKIAISEALGSNCNVVSLGSSSAFEI